MDFDGYAIGGVSVGEPEELILPGVRMTVDFLPRGAAALPDGRRPVLADGRVGGARRGHVRLRDADEAGAERDGVHAQRAYSVQAAAYQTAIHGRWRKAATCQACRHFTRATCGTC